jgi:hypothetical protein
VICSWLALHEYLATYAATCPGVHLATILGAGQDAGVQLLAEAHVDGFVVAGIALQAGAPGGLADRLAELLGRRPRRG